MARGAAWPGAAEVPGPRRPSSTSPSSGGRCSRACQRDQHGDERDEDRTTARSPEASWSIPASAETGFAVESPGNAGGGVTPLTAVPLFGARARELESKGGGVRCVARRGERRVVHLHARLAAHDHPGDAAALSPRRPRALGRIDGMSRMLVSTSRPGALAERVRRRQEQRLAHRVRGRASGSTSRTPARDRRPPRALPRRAARPSERPCPRRPCADEELRAVVAVVHQLPAQEREHRRPDRPDIGLPVDLVRRWPAPARGP